MFTDRLSNIYSKKVSALNLCLKLNNFFPFKMWKRNKENENFHYFHRLFIRFDDILYNYVLVL